MKRFSPVRNRASAREFPSWPLSVSGEAKLMKLDQRVERLERPPSLGPDLPNVLQRGPGLLRCRRQKYPEAIRRY